jgi:glutathione synthase
MRIGFVVNSLETEKPTYTTTRLAITALRMGHEAWVLSVGDFALDPDNVMRGYARMAPGKNYKSRENYINDLKSERARRERITLDDLDVLMLRNDPAEERSDRPWAQAAGIIFGQVAASRGVIVLNDPNGLADAINKMYFQHFPEEVRPRTLITRNAADIREFCRQEQNKVVLKPLQGSGGQNVFLVNQHDAPNLNQMIEAITRDGYVVAQEYLPKAAEGDVRFFMMNGRPLLYKGKYAAFRRVNKSGDMRSNMHVGGESEPVEVTGEMLKIAEIVRPKLVSDGMFLVGLDIVGDKLMEINVFSPGGFGSAQKFAGVDFTVATIEALERKVEYKKHYGARINNRMLATI